MIIKNGKKYTIKNKTVYVPNGNDVSLVLSSEEILQSTQEDFVRLIAEEGKILKKGKTQTFCIDTDSAEGWTEINYESENI